MNSETCCRLAVILLKLQFFNPSHQRPALFAEFASLQWSWQPGFCAILKPWKIMEEWKKTWHSQKKTIKILLFVYPRWGKRYEKIWKDLDWPSTIPQVTQVVNLGWDMTISCRSKTLQFVVSKLEQIQVLSGNVTSPLRITMFQTSW